MAQNEEARIPVYLNDEQAKTALKNLTAEAEKWRKKMYEAMTTGDMKGMKEAERELKKVTNEANRLKKETFDVNKVLSNLNSASINDLRKTISALRKEQAGLNRDSKEFLEIQKKINNINGELKKVNGKVTSGAGIGTFFGVSAGIGAVTSVFRDMVNVRKEFEKYEAILTNSLGSQKAARTELKMLQDLASKTPFSLQELTGSFVKLTNFGLKPTREELRKYGDIAASVGKSFDQFAEAIADAVTGEFERLKEFGIKANKDGEQIIFTFKGQATAVDNTAESIRNYLATLGDLEGVAGSMEAISKTIGGKMSNIGDAWDNVLNKMGERTGGVMNFIFETISGTLGKIAKSFEILEADELSWWEKWMGSTVATDKVYKRLLERRQAAANKEATKNEIHNKFGVSTVDDINPTFVPSTQGKETNSFNTKTKIKASNTTGPDYASWLVPAVEDPIDDNWIKTQADKEILLFAEKKRSEEEWTAFMKSQIDERTEAMAKEFEIEQEIAEAKKQLKEEQIKYAVEAGMAAVENAQTVEEAGRAILNVIRDQIKAYLAEAITVAALKALKGVPFPANMVAAAVAGGAANFLFNKLVPEFQQGGFTGYGDDNEIAGITHKNEFVVNANSLRNPYVRNAVNVIDQAQKTGKTANVNLIPAGNSTVSAIDKPTIDKLIKTLEDFNKKKLVVYSEMIKKDIDALNEIDKKRGL